MAKEVRYTYEGKEVGGLKKLVSQVVILEDQWVEAAMKHFAENSFTAFLKFPKALIRQYCGEELSDAQAWMLLHHITNAGVPLALRDASVDEKSRPAKVANALAGGVLGTMDSAVGAVAKTVSAVTPTKAPSPVEEVVEEEAAE